MQRKIFWSMVTLLGLLADFSMSFKWGMVATAPIFAFSWWFAYRSGWFE